MFISHCEIDAFCHLSNKAFIYLATQYWSWETVLQVKNPTNSIKILKENSWPATRRECYFAE